MGKTGELLEYLVMDAKKGNRFLRLTELHILTAIYYYFQDEIDLAEKELYAALIFGERNGLFMAFVQEGEPMAELLDVILNEKLEDKTDPYPDTTEQYLRNLMNVIREGTDKYPGHALEEPLSKREQEVLDYIATGLSKIECLFITSP